MKTTHPDWLAEKSVNLIIRAGQHEPALSHVPLGTELTKDPEKIQMLNLVLSNQRAPPNVPADRKAALVKAFEDTMKDPEFLAEAEKLKLDVSPMPASGVEALLKQVYATPPDLVARTARAIGQ